MKRILALCVCLILCATLLTACEEKDDFHCLVTVLDVTNGKDNGEEAVYQLDGEKARELFDLMGGEDWVKLEQTTATATATGTDATAAPATKFDRVMTLDFYTGGSVENAVGYSGTFQFLQDDTVFVSKDPMDMNLVAQTTPKGTYDKILKFAKENGKDVK